LKQRGQNLWLAYTYEYFRYMCSEEEDFQTKDDMTKKLFQLSKKSFTVFPSILLNKFIFSRHN